jgi:hypothetical protein
MKKNQIMNWVSLTLACVGVLFREIEWPFGNLLFLISLISVIVSTVFSFQANKINGLGKIMNFSITLILLIIVVSTCLSLMQIIGTRELRKVLMVLLSIILVVSSKENKVSTSFWISFLVYTLIIYMLMVYNMNRLSDELDACERKQEQVQVSNGQQ